MAAAARLVEAVETAVWAAEVAHEAAALVVGKSPEEEREGLVVAEVRVAEIQAVAREVAATAGLTAAVAA